MGQWLKKGTAALLTVSMLMGSAVPVNAAAVGKTQKENLKIACISDTHYLSPDMIKDTPDFTEHLNSDRKMFAESDAFLNATLNTIKNDKPDVLLISGDLTKDGEKECHEALAKKLEKFREEEMPDLHIYIAPGNHDLNNRNAYNFNTPDGIAVPAGRTTQEVYKEIYDDLIYQDESVIATFTPAEGKQAGGLSYVARPKDGFTIISIDSARYSADNTESGTDWQETSGAISADLEKWILEQIAAGKKRGDTVIGVQHHGYVPHFGMEPELLPMYLINDYERLSTEFADAGMQYVFTGHMHANDIAVMTTEKGNRFYDIETGSLLTYPSPSRIVTFDRTVENGAVSENVGIKTYTGISSGDFINPLTGEHQNIADITAYGEKRGFSNDMLSTTVNGFLHGYYDQIAQTGGTKKAVEKLLNDLFGDSLPVKDVTMEKLVDVGLPLMLPDGSGGEEFYFDSEEGGIVVKKKISAFNVNLVIPNKALKQTINELFEKVDSEILTNPEILDELIGKLVSDLTAIPAAKDGENDKTLLELVNFIYQSHLGGQDHGDQPLWVKEAVAKIEDGSLLESVFAVLFEDLTGVLDETLDSIPLQDVIGSREYNTKEKAFVPLEEGRVPLFRALDNTSANVLGILLGGIMKWQQGGTGFVVPEGTNPEVGYSTGEFLDVLFPLLGFDMNALLSELFFGTPADEEAGTEASEGLISAEMKGTLNGFLLGVVQSMGTDDNYPEDNDTTITYEWNLLTNRKALDDAIANAEKLDLSEYTLKTADEVSKALEAAKGLSLTASQEEMDSAVSVLNRAVEALEKVEVVDRSALNKAITAAEKLDLKKYTAETAQALTAALNAAKKLPVNATQEEVNAATETLNAAMIALKRIPSGTGNAPVKDNDKNEGNNNSGNNNSGNDNAGNQNKGILHIPQMGDTGSVMLWTALMFVACCGIITTKIYGKKKKEQ